MKESVTLANTLFLLSIKVDVQKKKTRIIKKDLSLFNNVFNMLKNSINKCKTKTKVIIKSCVSEYESCASEYESYASKPFDSNNERFDSVSNTKTWVSMLFEYYSCDSDSDSEYYSCGSDCEYDLCDSDSDSDSEYNSCDTDSEYDSYDSDSDSDSDKTDINDNKEIINQLNNFITLRKSFLNYINKIEVLKSEIQDNIYSDLPLLKYARMNNINELLDELLDYV